MWLIFSIASRPERQLKYQYNQWVKIKMLQPMPQHARRPAGTGDYVK